MKTVCKKLFSLLLVAVLLVSAVPFQASAATGDPVKVYFRIDNEATSFTSVDAVIGMGLGFMMPTSVTVTQKYNGLYSDGKLFTNKWVLADGAKAGTEITSATILSEDMRNAAGDIVLRAVFAYPQCTVTLNPNGGKVSPTTVQYQMHEAIGGKLPAPSRDGYVFAGWFTNLNDVNTQVLTTSVVTSNMILYAKWDAGSLPVVFQGWNGTDWVEVERRNPITGKSLSDSGLGLPIQSSSYGVPRSGYAVNETYPWIDSNGNVFTANTVVNAVTYVRPNFEAKTYTMTYNYNCPELATKTVSVKFDAPVNVEQPTRANYVFQGWKVAHDGKVFKSGDKNVYGDFTLVAQWVFKGTVELRIYRDDAEGFMTRYYSGAVLGEELDLNNCKIQNYLDGTYDFDGWYDYNGWVSYLGTKDARGVEAASNEITRISKITTSNTGNSTVTVIYGMVRNYKAPSTSTGSGSNNTGNNTGSGTNINTKPADPTNPGTGDFSMIEASVVVMTLTAAALVVMMQLRKRKMI